MTSSANKMWLCCVMASTLVAMATSAGNEYLPPSKGYNYDKPLIPFPPNNNGNKQTTPSPYRPPPQPPTPSYKPPRPSYIPVPQPGPPGPGPTHPNTHHDHHDQHDNHDHHEHHDHHDGDHEHHHHHEPGMPFDFSYAVSDDRNDYSHNAISDGDVTKGEYRVALPDGRTQIVKYTADWKNGFNAEVSYEGEARYPDQPTGYGSGPTGSGQAYNQGGGYQY